MSLNIENLGKFFSIKKKELMEEKKWWITALFDKKNAYHNFVNFVRFNSIGQKDKWTVFLHLL